MNYSTVLDNWLRERQDDALQPLYPLFYQDVAEYLNKLRREMATTEQATGKGRVLKQELENVEKMIHELVSIRLDKIIKAGLRDDMYVGEKLAIEERGALQGLQETFGSYRERLDSLLAPEQKASKPHVAPGFKLLKFLASIPAIIGIDMATYGPYSPGDVASIPTENAENLIRKGLGVEVEEESK